MENAVNNYRKKLLAVLLASTLLLPFGGAWAQSGAEQRWQVNFNDSDIEEVIKFVADVTGKTVVIDPRVKGRVKVISAEPLNQADLYDLFLSILEIQGFTAIEVGDVVRIVPRKDARTSAVPVVARSSFGDDAYITQVIQLENVSAAKVLPVLRPLAPQHAHLAAYAPSNAIIISDTVANITRLREVIRRLDRAGVSETDIIPLKFAQATEMVQMLQTLQKTDAQDAPQSSKIEMVADKRSNSILVTGDDVRRKRISDLISRLDVPTEQSGNVRVIYLEYANAEDVAEVLSKIVSNISQLEPEGGNAAAGGGAANANVEADPSTNSLLITADTSTLESLLPVIDRLDIRRAQVLVEGIIVEVSGDLDRQLGVEWAAFKDGSILSASLNSGSLAGIAADVLGNTANSLGGLVGQSIGFGDVDTNDPGRINFGGLIRLLQTSSEANILSTPSLLTTDNNTASISIGNNVPFVTGSFSGTDGTNPFQTIERRDVGILLSVTPQISEGNTLVLDIEQEVSSVNTTNVSGASDLITSERKISTQVIANDGETIILGGLIRDEVQETRTKMPLLGDIPVLGWLFRSDATNVDKSNLMVFLRATIVRTAEELQGATAQKYRTIREEQLRRRDEGASLFRDEVLPLLPVWEEASYTVQKTPVQ